LVGNIKVLFLYPKSNTMTIEQVKEKIYEHISREHEMGVPPHESWEGITEGEEWVDECIEQGYTIEKLQNEMFDEVYEEWSKENEGDN
jgi:hypothetical protein